MLKSFDAKLKNFLTDYARGQHTEVGPTGPTELTRGVRSNCNERACYPEVYRENITEIFTMVYTRGIQFTPMPC